MVYLFGKTQGKVPKNVVISHWMRGLGNGPWIRFQTHICCIQLWIKGRGWGEGTEVPNAHLWYPTLDEGGT